MHVYRFIYNVRSHFGSIVSAAMILTVVLPSGAVVLDGVEVDPGSTGRDLRCCASRMLGRPIQSLILPAGGLLPASASLDASEVRSGDVLTAIVGNNAGVFSNLTGREFAAVRDGRSVVTWGREDCGGDCRAVAEQLSGDVHTVSVTSRAGAAEIKRRRVCGDL